MSWVVFNFSTLLLCVLEIFHFFKKINICFKVLSKSDFQSRLLYPATLTQSREKRDLRKLLKGILSHSKQEKDMRARKQRT